MERINKTKEEKEYPVIPKFNDHQHCSGHANYMLDCEYTKKKKENRLLSV